MKFGVSEKIMEIQRQMALQKMKKDYVIKLFKHIVDGSGHNIQIRKTDYNLNNVLDKLIITIRPYNNNLEAMGLFYVGHRIYEHLKEENYHQTRFSINDLRGKYNTYRGISIIPVEYLEDEIILLTKQAFTKDINNYLDPFYSVTLKGLAMPLIINPKLIAVSRGTRVILEMTTKELLIEALNRDKNKYPYELVRAEIDKRGIK